ncbi:MAG: TRAP transporter substrate-binding protein [Rhizobiaceae bacterium]|nr:TRAP transporter substrate-binding protein [Rhizobiaceae bacterium]
MKLLAAFAGALLCLASTANAQETVLKFGHAASSKHLFHTGLEDFAKRVADKTGGKVKIEVYGDRQLGDDKQLLEGIQIGTIDGALVSSPTLPLSIGATAFDALQLPFVVGSYEQLSGALLSPVGDELLKSLDQKSIKGLGFIEAGQRHFLSRGKAVEKVADFAGLKTRIVPIPLHKATWEAVGVNPIGMAYGEVYSALETGTIDAVEINLSSIESESLYDAAKNVTLTGHYFWPGVLMMSNIGWQKLSPEVQAALEEAGRETTAEAYKTAAAQESEVTKALEAKGVTITKLSDLPEMQEKTSGVVTEWLKKDPLIQSFYDAVKAGK